MDDTDGSLPMRAGAARSAWRPIVWRGLTFLVAFLCGWIGFTTGVGVTERDLLSAGPAERAYYALGLFLMGGLDLGTPVGGPLHGRILVWTAYFLAPLITVSAVVEAAARLIGPLALRVRPLRDHVVLGGAGRLTRQYLRKLRQDHPRRTAVVVERNPNHPALGELRELYRAIVVVGDVTQDTVLRRLRVDRARRVVFLTGDDFVNLDGAAKVLRMTPGRSGHVVAHVSNLGFMRETAESSVARRCAIFNGHEFAATHLVREHLLARFHRTPERDLVVLAGFGRFGQTVLHQLQQHARGSFGHVLILDDQATRNARAFADQPGFSDDYRYTVVDGDMLDPVVWERVSTTVREYGVDPVVILGSGSDGTNLHGALLARKRHPTAFVIIRSFEASPFTEEIAEEADVEAFDLAGLIRSGMPASWF